MEPEKERLQQSSANRAHRTRNIFLIGLVVILIVAVLAAGVMAFIVLTNDSLLQTISKPLINDHPSSLDVAGLVYEKSAFIVGSPDGDQRDYQIRLVVHRGNGVDRDENVYLSGHSMNWPYDIRFQDEYDNNLDYWVESYNSNYAIVWVKMPSIPAYPATAGLNIFYGNKRMADASSIENTFPLGDEFTRFDTGKWSGIDNASIVNGTEIRLNTHSRTPDDALLSLRSNFSPGYAIDVWLRATKDSTGFSIGFPYVDENHMNEIRGWDSGDGVVGFTQNGGLRQGYMAGWYVTDNIASGKTIYHKYEMRVSPTGDRVDYLVDDSYKANLTIAVYKGGGSAMVKPYTYGNTVYVDRIIVRKYTAHEPTFNGWSPESATR